MSSGGDLGQRVQRALAEARWSDAAPLLERLCGEGQATWTDAADAWRRADRPMAALRCLDRQREQEGAGPVVLIQQAALLLDVGELASSLSCAERAVGLAADPGTMALALDGQLAVLLVQGEKDRARDLLSHLDGPAGTVARGFRMGHIQRLDGDLDAALRTWEQTARMLPERVETAAAHGTLHLHRADALLHLGHLDDAEEAMTTAEAAMATARRRPGILRVEALRARLANLRGLSAALPGLDRGIEYARDRKLVLMNIELCTARSTTSTARPTDLIDAIGLAEHCGAVLLEGQARLLRRQSGEDDDAERLRSCLAADRVLSRYLDG